MRAARSDSPPPSRKVPAVTGQASLGEGTSASTSSPGLEGVSVPALGGQRRACSSRRSLPTRPETETRAHSRPLPFFARRATTTVPACLPFRAPRPAHARSRPTHARLLSPRQRPERRVVESECGRRARVRERRGGCDSPRSPAPARARLSFFVSSLSHVPVSAWPPPRTLSYSPPPHSSCSSSPSPPWPWSRPRPPPSRR